MTFTVVKHIDDIEITTKIQAENMSQLIEAHRNAWAIYDFITITPEVIA